MIGMRGRSAGNKRSEPDLQQQWLGGRIDAIQMLALTNGNRQGASGTEIRTDQ